MCSDCNFVLRYKHNGARAVLYAGEKLQDTDVDSILKFTGTEEDLDGNIKYEGKRPHRRCHGR